MGPGSPGDRTAEAGDRARPRFCLCDCSRGLLLRPTRRHRRSRWDRDANRRIAVDLAQRSIRVAGDDAFALGCGAFVLGYFNEDIGAALAAMDHSLFLNPNSARIREW